MEYYVRDKGGGTRKVIGELLGHSSSKGRNPRWIEFTIYKTETGNYVVERVGRSEIFHQEDCYLVNKNHLSSIPYPELAPEYKPCDRCRPSRVDFEGLYPERDRPVFVTCETARGVVRFMEQVDDDDLRYLTNVARKALAEAAEKDDGIYQEYMNGTID